MFGKFPTFLTTERSVEKGTCNDDIALGEKRLRVKVIFPRQLGIESLFKW